MKMKCEHLSRQRNENAQHQFILIDYKLKNVISYMGNGKFTKSFFLTLLYSCLFFLLSFIIIIQNLGYEQKAIFFLNKNSFNFQGPHRILMCKKNNKIEQKTKQNMKM